MYQKYYANSTYYFFKVIVTEVLGAGMFYVQALADEHVEFVRHQLASLDIKDDPAEALEVKELETSKEVATLTKDLPETLDAEDPSSDVAKDESVTSKDIDPLPDDSNTAPFTPMKGEMVLALFRCDNSWNRAMVIFYFFFLHIYKIMLHPFM